MDRGLPPRKLKRLRDAERTRRGKSQENKPCGWELFAQFYSMVLFPMGYRRLFQHKHCGHMELEDSVLWMAVQCIAGCFAASIACTYVSSIPIPNCDRENTCRRPWWCCLGSKLSPLGSPTWLEEAGGLEISLEVGMSHWYHRAGLYNKENTLHNGWGIEGAQ